MKTMHSSSLYVMHLDYVSIDCSCPPLNVVLAELVCLVPSAATALCTEQLSSELGIANIHHDFSSTEKKTDICQY